MPPHEYLHNFDMLSDRYVCPFSSPVKVCALTWLCVERRSIFDTAEAFCVFDTRGTGHGQWKSCVVRFLKSIFIEINCEL